MQSDDINIAGLDNTQGKYRVSIGTSLSLEMLFGEHDLIEPTTPLPYVGYKYLMVNVRTLVRNLYNSVLKELKAEWPASKYLDKILQEISILPNVVNVKSMGRMVVMFYLPSYTSLPRKFSKAIIKAVRPTAYVAQHSIAIEQYCVAKLTAMSIRGELDIMLTDIDAPMPPDKSLIMTHYPVDLLTYTVDKPPVIVDLLESHTAVIKGRNKWYTKLSGKDNERIPFSRWSLQYFGDGRHFTGFPPRDRAVVSEFAKSNRWNQLTSDRLVKAQLHRLGNKEIADTITRLM